MKLTKVFPLTEGSLAIWLLAPCAHGGLTFTNLTSFDIDNGAQPVGGLIQGTDENFYSTTLQGGTNGHGTVFKMTPDGTLTTLVSFNGTNGSQPSSGLIRGFDGNFYGTTLTGGASNQGTIFQITTGGTLTTLASFSVPNGVCPNGLIQGADGSFYGTTLANSGGDTNPLQGWGTTFRMATNGVLTTLVSFDYTNGAHPSAPLVQGADGNFYGVTSGGGLTNRQSPLGYGTVFKMTPDGTLTNLVSFTGTDGACLGAVPQAALVQGKDGNFYGVTAYGGTNDFGTVFQMTQSGTLTTLVSINLTNNAHPNGLVQATDGNFYGTTSYGPSGYGGPMDSYRSIFQVTINGVLTTLISSHFDNVGHPWAGLIQGSDGNFYGTAGLDGTYLAGSVYRLSVPLTPAFQMMTRTNGALIVTWNAVASQTYQLQYTTDLSSTNWINLSGTNVAASGSMSATDSIGTDPQRFYRVAVLP